jgi:glutaminyl-peptide cyclotransferase
MRRPILVFLSLLAVLGIVCTACRSAPAPAPPLEAAASWRVNAFSADAAWRNLEALAAIGPRVSGTEGAAKARAYLRKRLTALGLKVESRSATVHFDSGERADFELVNLEATVPGDSPGLIVLAAPYDSAYHDSFEYLGVNDGASGAAVLLELARVIAADPMPYSVRFYFLDGEAPLGRGTAEEADNQLLGSAAAAAVLASNHELASIRLLLLLNRVSDSDLRIARDRFSHRTYREAVWRAAAELGYTDVFPPAAAFEDPVAGHRSFIDRGMRRVVAIVDPHFGAEEASGLADHSEGDTLDRSSPRSLEVVGRVVLASLESISAQLVKIDRFSKSPIAVEPEPRAAPEPAGAVPPEAESDAAPPGSSPGVERARETAAP